MHLFFYCRSLAFLLLKVVNKITDRRSLKAKLGIFVEEQRPQVLRVFGRRPTDHESLKTTDLDGF